MYREDDKKNLHICEDFFMAHYIYILQSLKDTGDHNFLFHDLPFTSSTGKDYTAKPPPAEHTPGNYDYLFKFNPEK